MPITVIDIIDTSVKIGLGAFIAAIVTLISLKMNHSNERKKDFRSHKLRMIEFISENCEDYFNAYNSFKNKLLGYTKSKRYSDKKPLTEDTIKNEFKELDVNFSEGIKKANIAVSRLNLINGQSAANELANTNKLICEMRNPLMVYKETPSKQELDELISKISNSINKFNSELSALYESIM